MQHNYFQPVHNAIAYKKGSNMVCNKIVCHNRKIVWFNGLYRQCQSCETNRKIFWFCYATLQQLNK